MPEAPAGITVSINGPYLVSGVPLAVKRPAETAQGEPIALVQRQAKRRKTSLMAPGAGTTTFAGARPLASRRFGA